MAYYDASSIVDGSGNLNVSTLIDQLDSKLAIRRGNAKTDHIGSPDSTSSSSAVNLDTYSISDVEPDDLITVLSFMWCSCGTANEAISATTVNVTPGAGSDNAAPQITSPYADTGGERDLHISPAEFTGFTGTLSLAFQWRRSSGSGTIYSAKRYHQWTIQKRRS